LATGCLVFCFLFVDQSSQDQWQHCCTMAWLGVGGRAAYRQENTDWCSAMTRSWGLECTRVWLVQRSEREVQGKIQETERGQERNTDIPISTLARRSPWYQALRVEVVMVQRDVIPLARPAEQSTAITRSTGLSLTLQGMRLNVTAISCLV
jgi:hypothetical protein